MAPSSSLISVIRAAWPAVEKYHRGDLGAQGIFSSYGNRLTNRLIWAPLIGRGCRALPPSDALCLLYATGSAEKGLRVLPPSVAAGAANPRRPSLPPLPTMAPSLSLISKWCLWPIINEYKRPLNGLSCNSAHRVHQHRATSAISACIVTVTSHGRREGSGVDLEPASVDNLQLRVDLWRSAAVDHVALGSAALGRGAADTPSVAYSRGLNAVTDFEAAHRKRCLWPMGTNGCFNGLSRNSAQCQKQRWREGSGVDLEPASVDDLHLSRHRGYMSAPLRWLFCMKRTYLRDCQSGGHVPASSFFPAASSTFSDALRALSCARFPCETDIWAPPATHPSFGASSASSDRRQGTSPPSAALLDQNNFDAVLQYWGALPRCASLLHTAVHFCTPPVPPYTASFSSPLPTHASKHILYDDVCDSDGRLVAMRRRSGVEYNMPLPPAVRGVLLPFPPLPFRDSLCPLLELPLPLPADLGELDPLAPVALCLPTRVRAGVGAGLRRVAAELGANFRRGLAPGATPTLAARCGPAPALTREMELPALEAPVPRFDVRGAERRRVVRRGWGGRGERRPDRTPQRGSRVRRPVARAHRHPLVRWLIPCAPWLFPQRVGLVARLWVLIPQDIPMDRPGAGPEGARPAVHPSLAFINIKFQNIWVHGNSGGNGRSTEASQRRHGGATEAVEAVEAPAEMAGRGVAETVEMLERLIKREGSQWQHEQTENRRKMHCEDGNGLFPDAGDFVEADRRQRGGEESSIVQAARPREGGAKEVGGGEQRRAKLHLGYSERVMVPFELHGMPRRPKAGGRRRATSGVVEAEAARCGAAPHVVGGGICTRRKQERRRRAGGGGGRKEAAGSATDGPLIHGMFHPYLKRHRHRPEAHLLAPSALTARLVIAHQVDLGRPPAADHVALGSAALGRGAADTPSVA
ncbi:hypothetical protein B0H14DRAFT_2649164 [Mycena olivaceomarginata]|nr:hypothetical protein B0H14DRAFT_2649164 [Mycena olivaceomarginata]